ncbi:IclR family transcriptional regulator [Muricoccus aerilatus]|uniref:IclR family transcriptional regulator n=1 Tax=Muricoccus aerilatus TaxID=452982 RepID=UPI0005C1F78D|nr:IclR family transcriptional regulator [Roseomonas aerilata]
MPRIAGPVRGEGLQAVSMALGILEFLARQPGGVGVTDLSRAMQSSKSRVHRHLRTLLEQGYVTQPAGSEKYLIGSRLVTLGRIVAEAFDLAAIARDAMRDLRDALGQSVVVSRAAAEGAQVLATLPSREAIEIVVKPGSQLALHCTAQGKITLAYSEPEQRERVLLSRFEIRTAHTISSPTALRAELERVRRRGWAVSPGESVLGVNALAAPIFDGSGALAGTIAIVGSIQFIEAEPSPGQIRAVVEAGRRVSALLGLQAPPAAAD